METAKEAKFTRNVVKNQNNKNFRQNKNERKTNQPLIPY